MTHTSDTLFDVPTTRMSAVAAPIAANPDDYTNKIAGAGALLVGGTTKGRLETSGDKDWFAVTLAANTSYWFTAKPDTAGGSTSSYMALKLIDGAGSTMASFNGYNNSAILQYTPTKGGTYYFEVGDYSSYYTGGYLASAVLARDDFANDKGYATAIAMDSTVSGKLEIASDLDAFKVSVQAGKTYLFELKTQDVVNYPSLIMYGQDGNGSGSGFNKFQLAGANDYRVYTATYSGDYYVTVDNDSSSGTAGYSLKVSSAPKDDFAGSNATTAVLPSGGKIGGTLDFVGDIDWIKVQLVAGSKYAFVLNGTGGAGGALDTSSSSGASVALVSSYGSYTMLSGMSGLAGRGYTLNADVTGDYYLAVRTGDTYSKPATGSYTLSAYNVSGDTVMPTVQAFAPANGAKGVSLSSNITLTFNESVRAGNGELRLIDGLGNMVETYSFNYLDKRIQIDGNVVSINPNTNLLPGTKYTLEVPAGSLLDYAGNKFLADEMYKFTTRDTVAQGTTGNDLLSGIGTNIRLSGGAGIDTVVYGSNLSSFTVSRGEMETKVLYRGGGNPAGNTGDMLTGVERLLFADRGVALDVDGNGGQAYRLYQAAYTNVADLAGLGYAIDQLDQGKSVQAVAQGILASAEFQKVFGANLSNETFISNLYLTALHRQGDAGGVAAWSNMLSQGMSRAEALVIFSGTAENNAEVLKLIGNGFEYTPYG